MLVMNTSIRIKIVKAFLWTNAVFLLFWWPLSHWFYPDFYHQLLGFNIGSYQDSLVKVIGTCGAFAVLLSFFAAQNPIRNRDMIMTLIVLAFFIVITFTYLIVKGDFPAKELINVCLSLISAFILLLVYPWGIESMKER